MEKKNFFKSETERNLWIKLNAERIQYSNQVSSHTLNEDLGGINTQFSPMWISKNQLEFDENERNAPRFSFEELLTLSQEDLFKLANERNYSKINEILNTL